MTETAQHEEQMVKGVKSQNRYDDIRPFKHTLVDSPDYINASYIKSALGNNLFIATQGPL